MKQPDYEVVIATYRRPESVLRLVEQLLSSTPSPRRIIVVDASPDANDALTKKSTVHYIRSSHANQPYQRYVGFLASSAELLLFFDDDMRIADNAFFPKLTDAMERHEADAVQPAFGYPHEFFEKKLPRSRFSSSKVLRMIRTLTGTPELPAGRYGYCGRRGAKPEEEEFIEWFNGPVFLLRRNRMYHDFNFRLFDLYEEGLGKGEDGITGYTYSRVGRIVYYPEVLFHHDPSYESTYTPDLDSFGRRFLFSRLYLSLEYGRLRGDGVILPVLHYHWCALWRVLGLLTNQLIRYQTSRNHLLLGYLRGWIATLTRWNLIRGQGNEQYWKGEALNDIAKAR